MMATPVLIPARNEEVSIAFTLSSLNPADVEPIVIINGCLDNTRGVAEEFGVTTIESTEGKVPAIQEGLRYLGRRALQPLLVLDADTKPIRKDWAKKMVAKVSIDQKVPELVGGLVIYSQNGDKISNVVHTLKPHLRALLNKDKHIHGANMLMKLSNLEVLEEVLDMPSYWPGEEAALREIIENAGGESKVNLSLQTAVLTDASRLTSVMTRLQKGREFTEQAWSASYQDDGANNTVPFQ